MKEGLTHSERKEWARTLYTINGKSAKETATLVNTDQAALRQWIADGSWDHVRRSQLLSKHAQLARLYEMVEKLTQSLPEDGMGTKEMDLINKYTASIKNLDTDNSSIYTLIDAAEQFIDWLYQRDLNLARLFTTHFDLFIKDRMATQG